MDWIREIIHWLVEFVHQLGYLGIFIMTFIESTFVPIPAEMTMIPAGYLVQQGHMNFLAVLLTSIAGTVAGSFFNYWIAKHYGRSLFIRYGRFFMMNEVKLAKLEKFFHTHGSISIFTGRLLPGIRHYISFPAGLARMDVRKFLFYTALGGAIWMTVLIYLGYVIGENQELAMKYLPLIKLGMVLAMVAAAVYYIRRQRRRAKWNTEPFDPPL